MTLVRGEGTALWRQIARELEEEVRHGRISPADRLPTEQELARRFGVNRHTVRRAVSALADMGVLRVEQGRGTFVQAGVVEYVLGERTRFSENMHRQALSPSGELVDQGEIEAPPNVARALKLRTGSRLIYFEILGAADDVPISLGIHYFSARRFAGLPETYAATASITAALRELGVADYTRKSTHITARLADPREAELLRLSRAQPLLVCEATNVDDQGKPIEFGVARFAADRVQLIVDT